MNTKTNTSVIGRRQLVGGALGGAALAGAGGVALAGPAAAEIRSYDGIWYQRTRYEPTGAYASFQYDSAFHTQLGNWLEFWYDNTPVSVMKPMVLWSIGAYVAGDDDPEGHGSGRAFDLSRIYADDGTGTRVLKFNGRYDQWKLMEEGPEKAKIRRWYWATSASANYFFRDVLHYEFNTLHWNHIHMDNTVSGAGLSVFAPGDSPVQVQHVQSCCKWIWGLDTPVTGEYDSVTQSHVARVLEHIGKTGPLTEVANWRAFNKRSLRVGTRGGRDLTA